jgi:IS605 OrfB family transposase
LRSLSAPHAVYADFDKRFYKFPSYLRRKAIAEAIGHISSHMSRLARWQGNGKGREPKFQPRCNSFPALYKGNMFEWVENGKAKLKLYNGSDWIWFTVPFSPIDLKKRFQEEEGWVRQNPMLAQKGRAWRLHFPFERKVVVKKEDFVRPVLSVDLGLTTLAVCSVVHSDGTVTHREFISYGGEKDRLEGILGEIAKKSAQTCLIPEGEKLCAKDWRAVVNLTEEIAHQCSSEIVKLAVKHNCQGIVFEHLGKLKLPRDCYGAKRLRRKLQYWLQGRIQRYCRYKVHAQGLRFSRVLARGTSEYTYDGSGKIRRIGNRQIAVFSGGGKMYNSDLSASYNIGARYWIREYSKSLCRKAEVVQADKSSPCAARHQQVLASLISLLQSVPHGDSTSPVPYPSQCRSQKETALELQHQFDGRRMS